MVEIYCNRQLFYNTGCMGYHIRIPYKEEKNMQQIGENISKFRREQNMTQDEFALRLGVTPQAVSKWERGYSLPDVTLVVQICQLLKVRADTLLGIDNVSFCENENTAAEREIRQNLIAEPLRIEIGVGLISCISEGLKTDYVNQCRKKLAAETGMLLPILRIRDSLQLSETGLCITAYDQVLLQTEYADTDEHTFYRIIDETVRLCKEHYDRILNKQLVKSLMDNLQAQYPGTLDGLVPDRAGYYEVMEYLRKTIAQKGNLRDLIHIMEELERGFYH